eukprot:4052330-Amphidinium_carterae.1
MISGRQAIVCCPMIQDIERYDTEWVLRECSKKFGISSTGSMCIVSGDDVVPAGTAVHDWPGIQAC